MKDFGQIIRENEKLMDHTESFQYVLEKFDETIKKLNYPILEVGVNEGGSSLCFMQLLLQNNKKNWHITVDPYGAIPYHNGADIMNNSPYDNTKYLRSISNLYRFANEHQINFMNFKMSSLDFLNVIQSIKLYEKETTNLDKFSFIHLDGSHDPAVVKQEILGFAPLLAYGGVLVVDDYYSERFKGFWDEFLTKPENHKFVTNKTHIVNKIVLEFKDQ